MARLGCPDYFKVFLSTFASAHLSQLGSTHLRSIYIETPWQSGEINNPEAARSGDYQFPKVEEAEFIGTAVARLISNDDPWPLRKEPGPCLHRTTATSIRSPARRTSPRNEISPAFLMRRTQIAEL